MHALRAYSTSTSPVLDDVAPPELGHADVRIQVAAATVHPVDVGVVTGRVRAAVDLPDPVGLGWDVSGTVTEAGRDVITLRPGDRVAGILDVIAHKPVVGTHAEQAVLPAAAVAHVPGDLDLVDAASLPLTALAASQAVDMLGPAQGRTLLVTGGAGALGGHAIVLARRAGWRVTALARGTDAAFIADTGAALITDLPDAPFDAVLDAGIMLEAALTAVRDGGSFIGAAPASPVTGTRGITARTVITQPDGRQLAPLLALAAEGILAVRIAGRVPLREAQRAYDQVAAGGQRGRWLLIP